MLIPAWATLVRPSGRSWARGPWALVAACCLAGGSAAAQLPPAMPAEPVAQAESETSTGGQIDHLLRQAAGAALPGEGSRWRVVVVPGALDTRLRLAPCTRIEPYLPAGAKPWGRTRVGLRCVEGPVAWNVTMPVTVKVFGPALVAAEALGTGTVLRAEHFSLAEADLAAEASPVVGDVATLAGRALSRPLAAGAPVRLADLQARRWFAAGDVVRVRALGTGFAVHGEGQALGHGLEGRSVRVRLDSGRVLIGRPVGERLVDVPL